MTSTQNTPTPPPSPSGKPNRPGWLLWLIKLTAWGAGLALAGVLCIFLIVAVSLAVAFPNLPDISELSDYRPKLPMRVYSSDGVVVGEFGEERRSLTPIQNIPKVMKDAVLAIEDARFFFAWWS